jgi:acetolactate decarboxylase
MIGYNMISKKYFNIITLLFFISSLNYAQGKITRTFFQSSPVVAILSGVMNDDFTVGEITKHGNFGLGTFNGIDGEMIVLDGKIYRVDNNGKVTVPNQLTRTPFVSVTYFHADTVIMINDSLSLKQLLDYLDKNFKLKNLIYAIKISGKFNYIESRSEAKQTQRYSNLVDVLKRQSVFKFKNIDGTMVGFKVPDYMQGVNIPGYHFHFLSRDKKSGGHILDCISGNIKVEIETLNNFELKFPANDEFHNAEFEKKPTPGL